MAQYDGTIRINTNIRIKEAQIQLASLENSMKKTADKITELRSKMDALKDAKIPTQEYKDISEQIAKATAEFDRLLEKQEQMQRTGKDHGAAWDELNRKMDEAGNTIKYAKGELQALVDTGKAFTLGSDTGEYAKLGQKLQYAESEMSVLNQKHEALCMKQQKAGKGYKELAGKAKSAFNSIGNVLKKADSAVGAFGRKVSETAQNHLPFFRKETEKTKRAVSGFAGRLKSLALSLLIFNQISTASRAASSAMKTGFKNLYDDNERFRASIDGLKGSLLTLQNAFAAAFSPIVEMALPYIQTLVEWLTHAVNLAGQFFAALTGRKTYTRAIKQTAGASKEAADAAREEAEAEEDKADVINRQLSPLDKLNNLTSEKADADRENKKDKDKDKNETGGAGGVMFEEVPIESGILDIVDKFKDILSKLFAPLKAAWDKEGEFVMKAWKYALEEVWKLVKDIGRDFLTVWQQDKTVKIFEDLLHIIGDIGLIIGHLARNFREAWNENETGLQILENIRDIIGVIVHNFRLAADETVKWADKLNFKPLLEAFERFTESLIPLADALSGILTDFYTQVLLPLGKWTLEKGMPELLDVFTAFNEKVDWDALRTRLSEFWDHLEPFAETVGEGLIIFIERVSDALADFINSEAFDNFLTKIEEWMDSVTSEDVADALVGIAEALIALKLAILGFGVISAVAGVLTTLTTFLSSIGTLGGMVISGAKLIGGGIVSILTAIGSIPAILAMVAAAVIGWNIGEWINEKLFGVDTPSFTEMMEGIKSSFTDGSWREALHLWGEDIKADWTEIWGYVKEDFNNAILGQLLGSFTDGTWREALSLWGDDIYNAFVTLGERQEEWLNSLKEKWSRTWNDIKGKIEGAIGSIRSTVGSAIDWIRSTLDSLKSSFNFGTGVAGGRIFSSGQSARSASVSAYAANPVYAALADIPIPGYATGQVIPRSMKQHLAVLGDNNRETEVVSPLSTIEQAVINAMAKVNRDAGNSGGTVRLEIPVIISGIGEIGRAVQQFDMEYFKQSGRHAFS